MITQRFAKVDGVRVTDRSVIDQNVTMSRSAVTPPKGHATRARNDNSRGRSIINPKLQWTLVILLSLAVMAGVFYFGRDVRSDYNGAGPSGATVAPAVAVRATGV